MKSIKTRGDKEAHLHKLKTRNHLAIREVTMRLTLKLVSMKIRDCLSLVNHCPNKSYSGYSNNGYVDLHFVVMYVVLIFVILRICMGGAQVLAACAS